MTAKKPAKKAPAKKKETRGRPTVWTDIVVQKIEEVASLDGSVEEMASYAGISRETINARLRTDDKFSARIADLRERPVLKARQAAVRLMENSYPHAMDYLARKKKAEFSLRTEHTGAEGAPLVITPVNYADLADNTPDTA